MNPGLSPSRLEATFRVMMLVDRAINCMHAEPALSVDEKAVELPQAFLEWLSHSRSKMFDRMRDEGARSIRSQPSHLAVMATVDRDSGKVNLATKGWGPVPRAERLEAVSREFEASATVPNLEERISTAKRYYSDPKSFDPSFLGGLEIFEGRTYRNLLKDNRASLLFTGEPPEYPSYQFDGVVTVVGPSDSRYEFIVKARKLFASDSFHIHQGNYPWGYLFRPTEVQAKAPFSRS